MRKRRRARERERESREKRERGVERQRFRDKRCTGRKGEGERLLFGR